MQEESEEIKALGHKTPQPPPPNMPKGWTSRCSRSSGVRYYQHMSDGLVSLNYDDVLALVAREKSEKLGRRNNRSEEMEEEVEEDEDEDDYDDHHNGDDEGEESSSSSPSRRSGHSVKSNHSSPPRNNDFKVSVTPNIVEHIDEFETDLWAKKTSRSTGKDYFVQLATGIQKWFLPADATAVTANERGQILAGLESRVEGSGKLERPIGVPGGATAPRSPVTPLVYQDNPIPRNSGTGGSAAMRRQEQAQQGWVDDKEGGMSVRNQRPRRASASSASSSSSAANNYTENPLAGARAGRRR